MSDIVERLRSVGTYRDNFPVHGTPEWCAQAAAEIERLRFALAVIAGGHHLGTVEDYVERTLRATGQPTATVTVSPENSTTAKGG